MSRTIVGLTAAVALGALAVGLNLSGCGGCVHESRDTTTTLDPAQSCIQLAMVHDQNGVERCGDGVTVAGVNNCADTLSIQTVPAKLTSGLADGGNTSFSADGGTVDAGGPVGALGDNPSSFGPNSSISFGLFTSDARQDPDGTLHWDLPAVLGNQSITVHVTLGPTK